MRALWGSLSICPLLHYVDLPYHTAGELLSISHFKIWGDVQKPHNGMAYLLVKVEDALEVKGYGVALMWISPHQAWASTMEEALEILSTCISCGSDRPYILTQLYEGTNHAPLPNDRHLGILPQGKVEGPCGQISQLKVHQLLSARLRVIYPLGLNRSNQSVIVDLPGSLHNGSSVTTDEHPDIKIDIPSPMPEEQDCANLPLGGVHATLAVATTKTSWKPRITLTAEVGNLLNWGMTEHHNREPECSVMVKEPTTKAGTSPLLKTEEPAMPLDTSSQVSIVEMEASMESNPVHNSPMAVASSSCSDSPTQDLSELQTDASLAVNHMLSIKRSSDLNRQRAIQDFKVALHQWEAERAAANKKAKNVHSRKELNARVKCATAVMKAKHDYRVAIQDARATRCRELTEAEAEYSETLRENAAAKSLQCAILCREHAEHMRELEERALEVENKSRQDFLFAHLAILCQALQSLKENLHSTFHLLLGQLSFQPIPFTKAPLAEGQLLATISPKSEPKQSPWLKRQHSSTDAWGDTSVDKDLPVASQEELSSSKRERNADWSSSLKPCHADAFSQDSELVKEARACYFATHPWDWAHNNMANLSDVFRELGQGTGLLGKSIHEIQVSWSGLPHLRHANFVLWSLPKGLKFLRVVSTKESPKVMGLERIHDPNVLQHFARYTYCPWCRKDGQNKGTIMNHLRTIGPGMRPVLLLSHCDIRHPLLTQMPHLLKLRHYLQGACSACPLQSPPREVKVMLFLDPLPYEG